MEYYKILRKVISASKQDSIAELLNDSIKELNVFVCDAFIENVEGKKIFNIILDSEEIIDLDRITKASRIINKIMDKNTTLLADADELDIFSKEKGENNNEC